MKTGMFSLAVFFLLLSHGRTLFAQGPYPIPLRINMGHFENVDSRGRTWLGDGRFGGDLLGIRPNLSGAAETFPPVGGDDIPWFCKANQSFAAIDDLGFNGDDNLGDRLIFATVRRDNGGDAHPMEFSVPVLPLPGEEYSVNIYFMWCESVNRHSKVFLEGLLVDSDVSALDLPGQPEQYMRSYENVDVTDGELGILIEGCLSADCPGSDFRRSNHPVIAAIEILSGPGCDHQGLDFNTRFDRATGDLIGTWALDGGADQYRVFKDGVQFGPLLAGDVDTFVDPDPPEQPVYTLEALDGDVVIGTCESTLDTLFCPSGLVCEDVDSETKEVTLGWFPASQIDLTGFEVTHNGGDPVVLGPEAVSYSHITDEIVNSYTVTPISDPPGQCESMSCTIEVPQSFEVPLRVNFGGDTVTDSRGFEWIGDGSVSGDSLAIRLNDDAGTETCRDCCALKSAETIERFGFDAGNPNDVHILTSYREDPSSTPDLEFRVEIPDGEYVTTLYFFECEKLERHFKVWMEGKFRNNDVNPGIYDDGPAAAGTAGSLTFSNVVVNDGTLDIKLFPCGDCPGATNSDVAITALEVVSCADLDVQPCPTNFTCRAVGGTVTARWDPPVCVGSDALTGYRVLRDGAEVDESPLLPSATSFQDTPDARVARYTVEPLVADGEACPAMSCTVVADLSAPFTIPLHINMGGPSVVDSRGQLWWGDGSSSEDPLDIRSDVEGAAEARSCVGESLDHPDAVSSLGFDPGNANDVGILYSMRVDIADDDGDGVIGEDEDDDDFDFHLDLEVPAAAGYTVNLYFADCDLATRSFEVLLQGISVEAEVSSGSFGGIGRADRLTYTNISALGGSLTIDLLPCPQDCPDATSFDAILSAIEVLPFGTTVLTCPRDLVVEDVGDGSFELSWEPASGVSVSGYDIFQDGNLIDSVGANTTSYTDFPDACYRDTLYEVAPSGDLPCGPDYRMAFGFDFQAFSCPFEAPVRINMGGRETVDSNGNLWLGDYPFDAPLCEGENFETEVLDTLGIRPAPQDSGERARCDLCNPTAGVAELGFDPNDSGDLHILSSQRFDVDGPGLLLDIPISDGFYDLGFYFMDCCCNLGRHFKIQVNGRTLDDNVSLADYADPPVNDVLGRLSFEQVEAVNGLLSISLLPCSACPGASDVNPILNALEIVPGEAPPEVGACCLGGSDCQILTSEECAAQQGEYQGSDTPCETGTCGVVFRRGDCDQSGALDFNDAIFHLKFLFLGENEDQVNSCRDACDSDDSGADDFTDDINSLKFLFLGQGDIPSPGPLPDESHPCGTDLTEGDTTDCVDYSPTIACP